MKTARKRGIEKIKTMRKVKDEQTNKNARKVKRNGE